MNAKKVTLDVTKVARLARLQLSKGEEILFQEQMNAIVIYFDELKTVDTEGVEPLVTPSPIESSLRPDEISVWEDSEKALDNAPERSGHLFKVPPVV